MKLLIDWTLYQSDLDRIAKEKKVIVFNFLSIRLLDTRSTEESYFAGQIEKHYLIPILNLCFLLHCSIEIIDMRQLQMFQKVEYG